MILSPKVPFNIDTWYGMGTVHGVARLENDGVVFEFQIQDNVFQVVKTDIKEVTLPIKDIESAAFSNGWFGFFSSMTITGHSLKAMENIPGAQQQSVTFSLSRKQRHLAREFVSQLNLIVSEQMLRATLPPAADHLAHSDPARDSTPKQISER